MKGFIKYAVGLGAMKYIPSFMKIGSGIQNLMGRGRIHRQTAWSSHRPIFIFSK
jgi:hypothetical protein